jgi:hypothetical protein
MNPGSASIPTGRKCYIKREYNRIGKFDYRVAQGILVGYSSKRKEYKCFNIRLNRIVKSINVMINETYGQNIKKESKDSVEQNHEEDLKEEEAKDKEEEQSKLEKEQQDIQVVFEEAPSLPLEK